MYILYYDQEHENEFLTLLSSMKSHDEYHKAAAYLLTLDRVLKNHITDVFDIDKDIILHEGLSKAWQTGTSKKTTRLLFNLWNSFMHENTEDFENSVISRYYVVDEIFSCNYMPYYIQALKFRFPYYAAEEPAKPYERLLKQITAKHNEEVKSNFQSGLLDFVPDEITPEEMLMQIIAGYAVRNCPEVLETEQGS